MKVIEPLKFVIYTREYYVPVYERFLLPPERSSSAQTLGLLPQSSTLDGVSVPLALVLLTLEEKVSEEAGESTGK